MKIGISVVTYYPNKNGVQFVTQNMAEGLVKRGHEVTVLTRIHRDCADGAIINGVKVLRCDIRNKNMFHFGNKADFHRRCIALSKQNDKMIFVCLESVAADWALEILDNIKCQTILYMHGMHCFQWRKGDFESPKSILYKIVRDIRWGIFYNRNAKRIKKFDKVIHLHEKDSAYLYFQKKYPGKNYVLENFAERIFFESKRHKSVASKYFIYVSNYHQGKNQALLLSAFYYMKREFKLVFVGSERNAYYDKLLRMKKRLDRKFKMNKEVLFLHGISREEIAGYLRNAYAFVMTSKRENFPVTVIEAMASGIPFLSTDVGVVSALPGGRIVERDKRALADAMDALLEDTVGYDNLKRQAFQYAEKKFTFEAYIMKLEKIILEKWT